MLEKIFDFSSDFVGFKSLAVNKPVDILITGDSDSINGGRDASVFTIESR